MLLAKKQLKFRGLFWSWLICFAFLVFFPKFVFAATNTGTTRSPVQDLGNKVNFTTITWTATTPAQTSITMSVKIGNQPDLSDGVWTSVTNGQNISAFSGNRYVQYEATLTSTDDNSVPQLSNVVFNYYAYATTTQYLVSSPFDSSDSQNVLTGLVWSASVPTGTTLQFQLRSAAGTSTIGAATWVGPSGDSSSFFTTSTGNTIPSVLKTGGNDRVFEYRAALTSDGVYTPVLSSVTTTYVVNSPPQIGLASATTTANTTTVNISYNVIDSDTASDTGSVNQLTPSLFQYCVNGNLGNCYNLTKAALASGATSTIFNVPTTTPWLTTSTSWNPKLESFGNNIYDANAVIRITVDDKQGANNTAVTTTLPFVLDTRPPTTTTSSLKVDNTVVPAAISLSATDNSEPMQMEISTDSGFAGASWVPYQTTTTLTIGLATMVYARFQDKYGNISTVSVAIPESPTGFMIQDTSNLKSGMSDYRLFTAWKIPTIPDSISFGRYRVFRATSTNGPWAFVKDETMRTNNFFSDSFTSADKNTTFYYRFAIVDNIGNTSTYSNILRGIPDGVQDADEGGGGSAAAAVISNVATSSVNAASAVISWDTDVLSNSTIGYSTVPGSYSKVVTVGSMVNNNSGIGNHQVVLSGLTPGTTYYFQVQSAGSDGIPSTNDNDGNGFTFKTTDGPLISSGPTVVSVANFSATISWNTDLPSNSVVYFSTSSNFMVTTSTADSSDVQSHKISLTGLSPGTKYYYYVSSMDSNGNINVDQNVVGGTVRYYSFFTTNDIMPPLFSGFQVVAGTSSAVIIWNTNEAADSSVNYGLSSYTSSTSANSLLTVQHSQVLYNLTPGVNYHYQTVGEDINGNLGTSFDQVFSTTPADNEAPEIFNVATSSISLDRATISWETDEPANGTVDYGTTMDYGSLAGSLYNFSSSSHRVDLIGLLHNTVYYFRINSTDVVGNGASSTGMFVTAPDNTAPIISNTSSIANDTAAWINWQTNEISSGEVDYGIDPGNLNWSVAVTSTWNTNFSFPLTGLSPSTTYFYQIVAADPSANTSTSGLYSFLTPTFGTLIVEKEKTVVFDNTQYPDTNPPVISNVRVSGITSSSAKIEWSSDKEGSSLVKFGPTLGYGYLAGDEINRVMTHAVTLSKLDSGTYYHFKAESFTESGIMGSSPDLNFTTLNMDGVAVEVPSSTDATSTPKTEPSDEQLLIAGVIKAPAELLASLLKAFVSNPALKQLPEELVLNAVNDITQRTVSAPTIVGLRPQVEVHGNSATVRWTTDKRTTGLVSFVKEGEYQASAEHPYTTTIVENGEMGTVHEVSLINLEAATRYHFQVVSKGEIGPESMSGDYVFQTEAVLPEIADIKIKNNNPEEITVNWKTNIPADSTLVYTDVKKKKTLTAGDQVLLINHSFTLHNLEPGATYNLVIKAKNETNNEVASSPLSFNTTIDKTPPTISNLSANSTLFPGQNSKVQTIISWTTDEPSTAAVYYQEGVSAQSQVETSTIDNNFSEKHIIVLTSFKPGTVYKYWIESEDTSHNIVTSSVFTMLTPIEKKTIIDIISKNFQSVFGWTKHVGL